MKKSNLSTQERHNVINILKHLEECKYKEMLTYRKRLNLHTQELENKFRINRKVSISSQKYRLKNLKKL